MPTYDYKCKDCEYEFEKFQSIKDNSLEKCPKCGGRIERLIGAGGGFIFKGSGFYITDNRSESYKKSEKKDSHTPQKKEQKDTTKEATP